MSEFFSNKRRGSAEKLRNKGSGSKTPYFKPSTKTIEVLFLLPKKETADIIFTTYDHMFSTGNGKNFEVKKRCSSQIFDGETDELNDKGWKIKDYYKDSDSKVLSEFWKNLTVDSKDHAIILDLKDIEKGPQVWKMPRKVAEYVIKEFTTCGLDNDEDYSSLTDFDDGKVFVVETNGETGFAIRYEKFWFDEEAPAGLIESGDVTKKDLEKFWKAMPDMEKLQPKFNKKEYEEYIDFIYDEAEKSGVDLSMGQDDNDDVDYSDNDENYATDNSDDEKEDTVDEVDDSELDLDASDLEEEKPSRGRSSRGSEEEKPSRGRSSRGSEEEKPSRGRSSRGSDNDEIKPSASRGSSRRRR